MPVGPDKTSFPTPKNSKLKSESHPPMAKGGGNKAKTFTAPSTAKGNHGRFVPMGKGAHTVKPK